MSPPALLPLKGQVTKYTTVKWPIVFLLFSECKTPLGLEWSNHHPHGAVKDAQMTASSADANYPAQFARYKHSSAWCANPAMLEDPIIAKSQYLQIDFLNLKRIAAILTQGLGFSSVVKNYYLYYATEPAAFHSLRHGDNNEILVRIFVCILIFHYRDNLIKADIHVCFD